MDKRKPYKIAILGLVGIIGLLWSGALGFVAYWANQDARDIQQYNEIGVHVFAPSEVIRVKVKQSGRTPDSTRYYVEYTNPDTTHTWRKRVLSKEAGHAVVEAGQVESRRIIEFSEDYTSIPAEQTAQEYIQSRSQKAKIFMYGAIVLAAIALIVSILFFRKFIQSLKQINQEWMQAQAVQNE